MRKKPFTYKGKFRPKNPQKYKGDPTKIIFRSLWERDCMLYFDNNNKILEWSSEEIIIPYRSPIDGKLHRYFPDFLIKTKNDTTLIEVKPFKQTIEPKAQKRLTKSYLYEVQTFGINSSKWESAKEYCKDQGMEFKIFTEDHINPKYK